MESKKELVSIAMATYNGEKYLRQQLNSLLRQTYKNIEIVVCDDNSNDKTFEILSEYATVDNRIKIYKNDINIGFKKNFEKIVNLCNGCYVAFCDQDDVWYENKIERCMQEIESNDFVCSNAMLVDSNEKSFDFTMMDMFNLKYIPQNSEIIMKHLLYDNFVQGATILAKKDFIKQSLPIPDEFKYHDWYFAFKALLGNGFYYIPEPMLNYRQHGNNVTSNEKKSVFEKIVGFFYVKNYDFSIRLNQLYWLQKQQDFIRYKDDIKKAICYFENFYSLKSLKHFKNNYEFFVFDSSKVRKIYRLCIQLYIRMWKNKRK